ncbi:MAG TPA: zinc-binding dehydrogenase [Candidatus Limnocylindrales bacterium]|nr:zinc-binding dehydrogenase [Candidatus Limnocylindrales bacterium]
MTTTRGAVFRGPHRRLSIEELRLDAPGPGEVVVRMLASGVCHSDLHVVDGEWSRPTGLVLGHEGAAEVEALGPGVSERFPGLEPGALVVLAWTAPCGRCPACLRGEGWLCARPVGSGHRLDPELVRLRTDDGRPVGAYCGIGTFGQRQVVAAEAAIPVDRRTPPEVAALIGCAVATGVGAATRTAAVAAGESVVIIGLGGVGLSALLGARLAGASFIVVVDSRPEKLDLARELGASDGVLASPGDSQGMPAGVRLLAPEGGFDHVLECIGLVETVELAVELVRAGGTVTLVGMTPQGARAGLDVYRFVDEGKRLLGSNYGSSLPAVVFPELARLHLEGRLPVERLISGTIGLEDVEDALEAMRRGDGARRVIVY